MTKKNRSEQKWNYFMTLKIFGNNGF